MSTVVDLVPARWDCFRVQLEHSAEEGFWIFAGDTTVELSPARVRILRDACNRFLAETEGNDAEG